MNTMKAGRIRSVALALVVSVIWNISTLELSAQNKIDLRIIPLEEDNRGKPERDVQVQVQDLSRGPLEGAAVTFTLPSDRAGKFSNGSGRIDAKTDRQGVATVKFRPSDVNERIRIAVEAQYLDQKATASMLSGDVTKAKSGTSRKLAYLLAAVGGAVVVGSLAARSKTTTPTVTAPTLITLTPGTPTVVGP